MSVKSKAYLEKRIELANLGWADKKKQKPSIKHPWKGGPVILRKADL